MWSLLSFAVGVFSVAAFIPHLSFSLFAFLAASSCVLFLSLCFLVRELYWGLYWRLYKKIVWLFFSLLLGLSTGSWLGLSLLKNQLPAYLEKQTLVVKGVVDSIPSEDRKKQRFIFLIKETQYQQAPLALLDNKKVLLSWYFSREKDGEIPRVKAGDRWQFFIRLRNLRGFVNPAGFDYQAYLLRQNIMATGYVLSSETHKNLGHRCLVNCWRQTIQTNLVKLAKSDHNKHLSKLPLLIALAIGNTQFMEPEDWQLLRDTGTIHLFAISGLHIGLAAVIGFFIGQFFLRLAALCFPFSRFIYAVPAVCSISFALLYALLAGMSLPTQRALIMVLVFYGGQLFFRQFPSGFSLCLALAIISVIDPLAIISQGFWLSFLAVAVLLYGFTGRPKSSGLKVYVFQLVYAQWLLFIALLLPAWFFLQGISLTAPIANLFAVSWVSFFIVPMIFLLLAFMCINYVIDIQLVLINLLLLLDKSFSLLWSALNWLNQFEIGFWYFPLRQPDIWVVLLAVVGSLWLLAPKGIRYRYLALYCFLPLLLPQEKMNSFELTFLDVGQGTAIVIRTKDSVWVYDTGPYYSDRFDAGQHIIAPYLRSQGIHQIDYLMVSHSDGDHSGGVSGLLKSYKVQQLLVGQPLAFIKQPDLSVERCYQGQSWQIDHVNFQVLWPPLQKSSITEISDNNHSCVLLITVGDYRVLLTGDVEESVEQEMLALPDLPKNVDILLVPHHGSKTSSSLPWVQHVSPDWAIVTAGFNNRYGHPNPDVLERYELVNSSVLNTAKEGAIVFRLSSTNDDWEIATWRSSKRRYWYN